MPEYLSPGVYIEEFEIGARPIEGVSTSTAGFLGETVRGPLEPRLVTGVEQFTRIYGGYLDGERYLTYAVDGFFKNGGKRCFIGRITGQNAVAASGSHDTVTVEAAGPGVWGDRIAYKIEPGSLQDPNAAEPWEKVKLTVMYWDERPNPLVDPTDPQQVTNPARKEPSLLEVFDNLNADRNSIEFIETVINRQSNLIRISLAAGGANPARRAVGFLGGTAGSDGDPVAPSDFDGSEFQREGTTYRTGLKGFAEVDEISILSAPDHHRLAGLDDKLIEQCTRLKDRFAVLHSTPGTHTLSGVADLRYPENKDTSYAAFYFPWIKVLDPRTRSVHERLIPPSGHVIGIYAQTDIDRGVHKAPANVVVVGATALEFQITKGEQDLLNPRGVNCIRFFPGRGIRVWGARTCSKNTLWKYINVRRLFLFIEESIEEGTQWVVFEPNNERLWARVKQTITQFLTTVWRNGALMGTKPEEAFFVKVDRTTMTQDDIDNGRLICIIGIAPAKPAEFVIFRLAQFPGGAQVTEL
ncbi:MAG: phage tail sheath family protein [Acidobacteria bacterium]|nr:MAG: phage tail sheath family protein [Acidobacteriota bacterium]